MIDYETYLIIGDFDAALYHLMIVKKDSHLYLGTRHNSLEVIAYKLGESQ